MITENKIINKYLKVLSFRNNKALNFSDDVYFDKSKKIIFSTDTYEEDIHFLNSNNPKKFAKKIFRSSISDIICKGCKPTVYFLSLSLRKVNLKWLKIFTNELYSDSKKYGLFLGGGDTIKSKKFSVTISVLGEVKHQPVLRKNAKQNEDIYVTGNLGNSYLGLLVNSKKKNFGKMNRSLIKSFLLPDLPFKFSKKINNFASSSMDISDGLLKDLNSLCTSSKCGAHIYYNYLPFSKNAQNLAKHKKVDLLNIFSKGDDYQILFTANKKFRRLISSTSKNTKTKVTRIGKVISTKTVKMTDKNIIFDLRHVKTGYIHKFNKE